MLVNDRFARRVGSVEELPEPFRRALLESMRAPERVSLLIHSRLFATQHTRWPAAVVAIWDQGWLVVTEEEDGSAMVHECSFGDTLLLELTLVLLHGQLRIDFVRGRAPHWSGVEFNTVVEELYREAVGLILGGIEGPPPATDVTVVETHAKVVARVEHWPLKFRNLALHYLPAGRHLRDAVYWPTLYGGLNRELVAAGALLLTECELVLIAEQKSNAWFRERDKIKFGEIITYFPLGRLAGSQVSQYERFSVLGLEMHASHGGEKLEILFPSRHADAVAQLMARHWQSDGR